MALEFLPVEHLDRLKPRLRHGRGRSATIERWRRFLATMMNGVDVDFACTQCAKCCHDLRLPLTVDEAIDWLSRGGTVELLSEAMPWLGEPPPENVGAAHKRRRSFAASSGELPVRVAVIVAAAFSGPCPNLRPDKRCGIYPERPLVCRIYPAEINPAVQFDPRHKACPPDAWTSGAPALVREGRLVDAGTIELIERSRQIDTVEVAAKAHLCRVLGIDRAALSNEGFVVYSPDAGLLLNALRAAKHALHGNHSVQAQPESADGNWRLVSDRRASVAALASVGARGEFVGDEPNSSFRYLSFGDPVA